MKYLVLSCSLNPGSRSRVLAAEAAAYLRRREEQVDLIDLADLPLPLCDGDACYNDPNAKLIKERIVAADGILMGVPIYNFDISAAAKNVIELTGRQGWSGKVAGFLCAAGGRGSYMAVMQVANSLMLDFRTVIVPRFVYTTYEDFNDDGAIVNPKVVERIHELGDELVRFTSALSRSV